MEKDLSLLSDQELFAYKQQLETSISQKNNNQMALKILMNSFYGAFGNTYFKYFDLRVAESITSSGQLAIRWIANKVSGYLNKTLKTENIDYCIYTDTDSVVGDTIININNKKMTIEDYWNTTNGYIEERGLNNQIKHLDRKDITYSFNGDNVNKNKVNYIMKHKVKKRMFKIKLKGKEVIVTEDHSLCVIRDNKLIDIKPKDLIKSDSIVVLKN